MESGTVVRVIRDFLTTTEGELCINAGEFLQVVDRVDRHWVRCRGESRSGLIPSSNVSEVSGIGRLRDGQDILVAANDFEGEQEGDLTLRRGQLVVTSGRVDEQWSRGRALAPDGSAPAEGDPEGVFPTSFCWRMDNSLYVEELRSRRGRVEKFAQVVHSMRAQLPEEMDLQEGDVVRITEILDRDWCRGECKGRSGTFPSSFVRVIDAFPGSEPPPNADLKSYLDAPKHKANEYQNTRNQFAGLEDGLKKMGREAALKGVVNGLPEIKDYPGDPQLMSSKAQEEEDPSLPKRDASIPKEIFEDDYFRQNLPASYGTASVDPSVAGGDGSVSAYDYDAEKSIFGGETARCSKGFQDMSENLRVLHWRQQSLGAGSTSSYHGYGGSASQSFDFGTIHNTEKKPALPSEQPPTSFSSLTPTPDYNRLSDNLSLFNKPQSNGGGGNGVEEQRGLMPSADYNRLSENLSVFNKPSSPSNDAPAATGLNYNRLSENLAVFETSIDTTSSPFSQFRPPKRGDTTEMPGKPPSDFVKLSENLSVFSKFSKDREEEKENKNPSSSAAPKAFAYQTVTCEGMGYTGERVDVKPYAVAKFNFVAEFDNELGLSAGEMVYLNRYVDNEWLEGEVDEKRGLFPIGYVNIIVDCNQADSANVMTTRTVEEPTTKSDLSPAATSATAPKPANTTTTTTVKSTAVTVHDNLEPDTYHRVLYNFSEQVEGDVSVAEGEVVLIRERQNEDWVTVETCQGERGSMPGNHLDPRPEFDGKAVFEIERLLSYKHREAEEVASRPFVPPKRNPNKDALKFFDPLRSPDGEMMKVEEELQKRVTEPKVVTMPDNSVAINSKPNKKRSRSKEEEERMRDRFRSAKRTQPKDLETLISTNLSKLRSTSPSGAKVLPRVVPSLTAKKVEISGLVLQELQGKGASSGNPFQDLQEKGFARPPDRTETPLPRPPSSKKSPAPPRPPGPTQQKGRASQKPKAPKPPVPAPPSNLALIGNTGKARLEEPVYSQVNKEAKSGSTSRMSEVSSDFDESVSVVSSEDQPPSYPPPRPSKPPLFHSMSLPASSSITAQHQQPPPKPPPPTVSAATTTAMTMISADVHKYDTPENGTPPPSSNNVDETPTNEHAKLPSSIDAVDEKGKTPSLINRTSSYGHQRQVSRGETFRSYVNMSDLSGNSNQQQQSSFPPDRKSPMSPPVGEVPPKVASLPCRSVSVASSIKSRSVFYNSVTASERGYSYSPAVSSLNHSYETLNALSEAGEQHYHQYQAPGSNGSGGDGSSSSGGGGGGAGEGGHGSGTPLTPRKPSRPAPPVPVKEQFEHSKEVLFGNKNAVVAVAGLRRDRAWVAGGGAAGPNRCPATRRNLRHRKIHSLKRQIQIKEKMLEVPVFQKEQLLRELDMYQEIAVAKGEHYDRLNRKMDHCQESIETLSDEIQRLQACLADEELKQEEDSVEETRRRAEEASLRRQLEVQKREEEKRKREERIKRNREHRENVISELVQTESEFCRDLKLTWQAFGLDTPEMLEQRSVDVASLFGNLAEVIEVSEKFLESLQGEVKKGAAAATNGGGAGDGEKKKQQQQQQQKQSEGSPLEPDWDDPAEDEDDQRFGRCFLDHAPAMKRAYTEYCVNNDKAEQLLEKYESTPEVHRLLQKGVETLQGQVACFNMGSILIKPVQRILKYPLILNELIKSTEDDHRDKPDLRQAVGIMSDIAAFINDSKRRKDIVDKYRHVEDKTITRKISRLNMHSIGKKSSRMGQKFMNSIGIEVKTRDYGFDELERRFSQVSRAAHAFCADAQKFRENLHEVAMAQFNVAENVADLYKERVHTREVERFRTAHRNIISTYWNQYNLMLESRVVKPLRQLLDTFQAPTRLIQKRQDKHLDYSASMTKSEKNKDPTKAKVFREEMDDCKATYEALNSQLVEELPKLIECSLKIYCRSVSQFILLRKLFVGRVTRELLSLMDLPLLSSAGGDILEIFMVKHSLVCNQLGRFSFSRTFRPPDDGSNGGGAGGAGASGTGAAVASNGRRRTIGGLPTGQGIPLGQTNLTPQSAGIRTFLRGKYAAVKLFQARELYHPMDPLDIGVNPGDLVGVVQKKDPMGSSERWFVDNGVKQGFVPARVLASVGQFDAEKEVAASTAVAAASASPPAAAAAAKKEEEEEAPPRPSHEYDDVAEDEEDMDEDKADLIKGAKPTRKAPPVPPPQPTASAKKQEARLVEDEDEIKVAPVEEEDVEPQSIRPEDDIAIEDVYQSGSQRSNDRSEAPSYGETGGSVVETSASVYGGSQEHLAATKKVGLSYRYEEIAAEAAEAAAASAEAAEAAAASGAAAGATSTAAPPSENNSDPSQDLSPIYEEIHGGSRSTVSSSSCATSHSSSSGANANASAAASVVSGAISAEVHAAKGKFHYSLYGFVATDSTMLSVKRGQVIRVIQVTPGEWWYVEDRHGDRGYVPHTYLRIYPASGIIDLNVDEEIRENIRKEEREALEAMKRRFSPPQENEEEEEEENGGEEEDSTHKEAEDARGGSRNEQ